MDIAVLVDNEGKTCKFEKGGVVKVYRKKNSDWMVVREKEYDESNYADISGKRKYLRDIASWLGECKVLIVEELNGIYFTIFEGLKFTMWEVEGIAQNYLDYVFDSEMAEKNKEKKETMVITPEQIKEGDYYINLKGIMNNNKEGLTSKQILLPFFHDTKFDRLIIDCDHVPRWFNYELSSLGLRAEVSQFRDGMKVTVLQEEQ